jgi:hypothetical protein
MPGSPEVPVIGQPKVLEARLMFTLKCSCGAVFLCIGTPNTPLATCKDCKKIYGYSGAMIHPTGEFQIAVGSRLADL